MTVTRSYQWADSPSIPACNHARRHFGSHPTAWSVTRLAGMLPVIAEIVRSGFVEGHHHGSVVALDVDGRVAHQRGETATTVLPRSCNKPLQALAMVRAGLDLEGELLALACASHSGEPFHLDGVRRILAGAGLEESALQDPPDWPLDDEAKEEVLRTGGARTRLQ